MSTIDKLIAEDKLTVIDDSRNALDLFVEQRARAPRYAAVESRSDALLAALKKRIDASIKAGAYDDATLTQGVVAGIWPQDSEIAALPDVIAKARAFALQSAQIEQLLKDAQRAQNEGRDTGVAGTYALLAKAAAIAPADKRIRDMQAAVLKRLLRPAEIALQSADLAEADRQLTSLASMLRSDPAWAALRAQLDQANQRRELDRRLASLYARFDGQINQGRLTEPAADNALQTLEQIRALDGGHRDISGRTERLADALVLVARRSLAAGDASAALQQIDVALRVLPGQSAAMALKSDVEGKLSADQRRLVKLIGDAREALVDGRFVAPVGDNARELLEQVLRLDPGNADALAMRAAITERIADAAKVMAAEAKLDQAIALVREARPLYPTDAGLAALARQLDEQRVGAERELRRRDQIERIQRAADQRPLVEADVIAALDLTVNLLASNPRDVDVLTARHGLFDGLGESLAAAGDQAELDVLLRLVDGYRARFAADPGAEKLLADAARARARVAASDQARLAASVGDLVLIAYPWGQVESVIDSTRKPVSLPADATTPLQLRLPAGVYRVVFSHPVGGRSSEKMVQVKAGAKATGSASFTQLNAQEYARRAGL